MKITKLVAVILLSLTLSSCEKKCNAWSAEDRLSRLKAKKKWALTWSVEEELELARAARRVAEEAKVKKELEKFEMRSKGMWEEIWKKKEKAGEAEEAKVKKELGKFEDFWDWDKLLNPL